MLESLKQLYLKKESKVMVEHYKSKTNFAFTLLLKMEGKC